MKHKRLTVLFCLSCLFLVAGILTACRQSVLTKEKIYEDGYNCEVIFDLTGGKSGKDDRERDELHQYVQSGSPIIKPGTDKNGYSGDTPVKEGYTFGGFYRGTKGEDGTVTYGEKWDFAKDKVTGDLTLYAYWRKNYTLNVHYGENLNDVLDGKPGAEYKYDKVATFAVAQSEDGVAQQVTPSFSDDTVIAYYGDEATAQSALTDEAKDEDRIIFPMAPEDEFSEENTVWDIYANVLKGTFTVVREKSQFRLNDGSNIYLMTDIDCANENNERTRLSFPNAYSGTLYGNGHKISNFTVSRETTVFGDAWLGLFIRLEATSHLQDITFDNFLLTVSTTDNSKSYNNYVGALAGRALEGTILKNVTLRGTLHGNFVEQNEGKETICEKGIGDKDAKVDVSGLNCTEVEIIKTTPGTGSD